MRFIASYTGPGQGRVAISQAQERLGEPQYRSLSTERWVVSAAILASAMAFIDGTALNVALPALQRDLDARGSDLLWIMNAYLLFLSALMLVGGSLGDRYGRKRVFMSGIALFALASLICGLAPNSHILIAARAFQGLGGALMVPGSLSIITATVPEARLGRAIGTWSALSTITTILGPVLGGYLASAGLWRGVFFINLPLAAVALLALALKVPESRDATARGRLDIAGALLVTLGLAGITYGSIEAPGSGLDNPTVASALVLGVAAFVGFALVETRSREPTVPFALFRSSTFTGSNLLTLFLYAALSGGMFFLTLNLIQIQGYDERLAGLALLPLAILLTLLSRWAGGAADRYGPRLPLIIGPTLAGAGFLLLALPGLTAGPTDYWSEFLPGLTGVGLGMGITVAPLTTAVMSSVSTTRSGIASGINNAVARTAGVLSIAVLGGLTLLLFGRSVAIQTAKLDLTSEARASLRLEAGKLGEAQVPTSALSEAAAIQQAYRTAFVDTFRVIIYACAGLSWLGALSAALFVERRLAAPGLAESS